MPGNEFPLRGQDPAWLNALDSASQAEWRSLARESDPELYQEGLLQFAGRQAGRNQEAVAGSIYSSMLEGEEAATTSVARRARERLAALNGGGSTGARAEYLLRHITREISDPSMILAMGAAGGVFRLTRLATLSRLGAMESGILTRGAAARGLASLGAFAAEAPTFTMAHRLGRAAMGHAQDWSASALSRDFAASYLMLGAMKVGTGGAGALQRFGGYRSAAANAIFQQTGMLGGIAISQGLERRLGWRPATSGDSAIADALLTWLQFNAAGRLSQSVLGPRFQAWEQGMDRRIARAEAANRPETGFSDLIPGFQPATAGPGMLSSSGPISRPAEPLRPNVMMMSGSGSRFGKDLGGLGSPGRVGPIEEGAPNDPRAPFFRIEVPRSVRSRFDRGEGTEFQYRLLLDNFDAFLQEGPARSIATREGREIRLRLMGRETTQVGNQFLPPGLEGFRFEIQEGSARGEWLIYVTSDAIMSFSLTTSAMRPGVGGIALDWMASQAAATTRQSQFAAIHNFGVFHIIEQRRLIDERSAAVEARPWKRLPNQTVPIGRFGDADFIFRNRGGYFNVWAYPRQGLVPPELRTLAIERFEGSNADQPYLLHIQALRNFLTPGFETTIAERGDRAIRARVKESVLVDSFDRFMPAGTPRIALELREYDSGVLIPAATGGKIDLYVEPNRLSLANLERGGLEPGAGTILLDWVYTQAAARNASVDLLNIRNPKIWEILTRDQHFDLESARVELGHWDWLQSEFQLLTSGPYRELSPIPHYQPNQFSMAIPVAHLRSRANPLRVPDALKSLRSD